MKIKNSLKSLATRHRDNRMVRRRGRIYIINKKNPRFKARRAERAGRFLISGRRPLPAGAAFGVEKHRARAVLFSLVASLHAASGLKRDPDEIGISQARTRAGAVAPQSLRGA